MRHEQSDMGHSVGINKIQLRNKNAHLEDFVLEKSIFNNIFEKDIRRVFIYKKAERLAKAIHLIAPAFAESAPLRNRIDAISIGLVDAAVLPLRGSRTALSRELLALSSILSLAHVGGILSSMNAELIAKEAHMLLQEIASYEDPSLFFDETPTLSDIAKNTVFRRTLQSSRPMPSSIQSASRAEGTHKGHIIKDINENIGVRIKDRKETILSVIKNRKRASIKDISTVIRNVSEKTIQRELSALIEAGAVLKQGERRWSTYSLT